jgi:hypothetical protein
MTRALGLQGSCWLGTMFRSRDMCAMRMSLQQQAASFGVPVTVQVPDAARPVYLLFLSGTLPGVAVQTEGKR